jgi:hypothetical protein
MITRRMGQLATMLLMPVFFAGAFASTKATRPSVVQTVPDQPNYWVAFSAGLERTNERGEVFSGRIYRASDGSTRYETGVGQAPAAITLIGIQNVTQRTSYHWNTRTGWSSGPIELPPQLWQPHPARASGYTETNDTLEGFRLVKASTSTQTTWYAPRLNMYPVNREVYNCGSAGVTCYMKLSSIRLEEPPTTLFQLPAQ